MHTIKKIQAFVYQQTGADIPVDGDIFAFGVGGDDFHDMIEEYASTFSVDMKGYLWYFHADEEGQNIGGLFFAPPYRRVKRIPITPEMLLDFANKGRWELQYPPHSIPARRTDILINQIIAFGVLVTILVLAFHRC